MLSIKAALTNHFLHALFCPSHPDIYGLRGWLGVKSQLLILFCPRICLEEARFITIRHCTWKQGLGKKVHQSSIGISFVICSLIQTHKKLDYVDKTKRVQIFGISYVSLSLFSEYVFGGHVGLINCERKVGLFVEMTVCVWVHVYVCVRVCVYGTADIVCVDDYQCYELVQHF